MNNTSSLVRSEYIITTCGSTSRSVCIEAVMFITETEEVLKENHKAVSWMNKIDERVLDCFVILKEWR